MTGNKNSKEQEKRRRRFYRRTPVPWHCRVYKTRARRRAWAAARDAQAEM